jgi:hypothetical protein
MPTSIVHIDRRQHQAFRGANGIFDYPVVDRTSKLKVRADFTSQYAQVLSVLAIRMRTDHNEALMLASAHQYIYTLMR